MLRSTMISLVLLFFCAVKAFFEFGMFVIKEMLVRYRCKHCPEVLESLVDILNFALIIFLHIVGESPILRLNYRLL